MFTPVSIAYSLFFIKDDLTLREFGSAIRYL